MTANKQPTDFNDLHRAKGKAAVAAVIANAASQVGPSPLWRRVPVGRGRVSQRRLQR